MAEKIYFHPSYLRNKDHYARHRDWLESRPEVLGRFLEETYIERTDTDGKEYYAERKRMLDVDNQLHALLTIHQSELAEEEPTWGGMDDPLAEVILEDIDGKGTSAWKLAKEIIWQLLWAGVAFAETFAPAAKSKSKGEARESGERSFTRLYEPDEVVQWEFFDDDGVRRGQLRSITFLNRTVRVGNNVYQTYKRYWIDEDSDYFKSQILRSTKTINALFSSDHVEVKPDPDRGEEKQGELEFIPVTVFGDPDQGVVNTVLFRASFDAIVLLNKQSQYDTTTRYNHYPRHIVSGSDDPEQDSVNLPNTGLGVVSGRDIKIHTLQAADPVALWRDIRRLEQSIRHKVLLQINQANAESREQPSVDSKRADAEARKKFYNEITDVLEYGLSHLFGLVHAGFEEGIIEGDGVQVQFRRDFSLKDFEMEMQEQSVRWSRAGSMGKPGTAYRKRLFINDLYDTKFKITGEESEDEVRQEIIDAVLAMPDEEFRSPLADAYDRRLDRPDEGDGGDFDPKDRDRDGVVNE